MTESRTFVLVHGGFHGGWCWTFVREVLEAAGHRVTTPTLTGLGERAHLALATKGPQTGIEDVVAHLVMEDLDDVVLVGHSLSGPIVTGVADRLPERIAQLVFLDAILVEDGECASDTVPADVTEQRRALVRSEGEGIFWPSMPLEALGIPLDHPRAEWVRERMTPLPFVYYEEPLHLRHPVGNGLPVTYVICSDPMFASLAGARERARSHGWSMREITTGHDAMVLQPQALASMLIEIAEDR